MIVKSALFQHNSQIDHLRPTDARAQIHLNAQHDVQFDSTTASYIFSLRERERVCVMYFVCEAEKSATKTCLYRCTMWMDGAPMTFQWHGRTTVSDHLPSDKLE